MSCIYSKGFQWVCPIRGCQGEVSEGQLSTVHGPTASRLGLCGSTGSESSHRGHGEAEEREGEK